MDVGLMVQIALPVATVAAAWGGTRQALNGTRTRVKEINENLSAHIAEGNKQHTALVQRVAVVETKVDALK